MLDLFNCGVKPAQFDSVYAGDENLREKWENCPLAVIDKDIDKNFSLFKDIESRVLPVEFVLCLKNKDFFGVDFVGILTDHLKKKGCSFALIERITTASQEAYSNAFLWSSLDLQSQKDIRPYQFYEIVQERLEDPIYANRHLGAYLAQVGNIYEVVFHIQGRKIVWPDSKNQEGFRGTSIILSQADQVEIDPDGKAIRLFFRDKEGKR